MDPHQQNLNARFYYRADSGESWRILKDLGDVYGDCEDYSLTLIWMREGRSMWRFWWSLITFKYVLFYATVPSGGHVVVRRRGGEWTDNIVRSWVTKLPSTHKIRFPILPPMVALKFLLRPALERM